MKPMHERYASGGSLRRFESIKPKRHGLVLQPDHPSMLFGRTIFPTTVNDMDNPRVLRLLKSGHNSRKIGKVVTKGKMKGFPIFTLTLEERATCPRTCEVFDSCYGNGMPYAQRLKHGPRSKSDCGTSWRTRRLPTHKASLSASTSSGISTPPITQSFGRRRSKRIPALHVFGYTARDPQSDIGQVICEMLGVHSERFHIRFSAPNGLPSRALVVGRRARVRKRHERRRLLPARWDPV
jgi:hypothetical protein